MKDRLTCKRCKAEFDKTEACGRKEYLDDDAWGGGPSWYLNWPCCPVCGSDEMQDDDEVEE